MKQASRELRALRNALFPHEKNSVVEKAATWVGLIVVGFIIVGIMTGDVRIETGPQQFVWDAVKLVVAAMLGRLHGRESERLSG